MEKSTNAELCNAIWEIARNETSCFRDETKISIIEKITAHFNDLSLIGDYSTRCKTLFAIKQRLDTEKDGKYKDFILELLQNEKTIEEAEENDNQVEADECICFI